MEQNENTVDLERLFSGDKELAVFFSTWLKCERNGTKAWMMIHPGTSYQSAKTLASRMLKRVDIGAVLEAYDLGMEKYFQQLKEGLEATVIDSTGHYKPDHKTRRAYHQVLGQLHQIEGKEDKKNDPNKVVFVAPDWFKPQNPIPNLVRESDLNKN